MRADTARIEAFSDGVIAVAITLLILNIHLPDVKSGLLVALLLPSQQAMYLSYVTSFLVIGIFWANHHNLFNYIEKTDHALLLINTIYLLFIVTIPFGTTLLSQYINQPVDQHVAAAVYSLTLLMSGISFNVIWWYAARKRRLINKTLSSEAVRAITINYLVGIPLYVIAFFLSLLTIQGSLILYIVTAIIYSLPRITNRILPLQPEILNSAESTPIESSTFND